MTKQNQNIQLYEVIRIIDGIPVFLEDHLDRLYHSAHLTGKEHLPGPVLLTRMINDYLHTQRKDTGNIKLTFTFSDLLTEPESKLDFIPHYYPTPEEYTNGVKVGLLQADRPIPHAKIQNSDIRNRANEAISEDDLFEVLLVDTEGNITEGSRSNVFFIKNNTLYSAPEEKILRGITWMKIRELCKKTGISIIETAISSNQLDQFEGAFLTGTSPKVLPVSAIEQVVYNTDHPLLLELRNRYNQLIEDYLLKRE